MGRFSRSNRRKLRKVYAVIVDGETERWYLLKMEKNENLDKINIKPELKSRRTIDDTINQILEYSKVYDKVFWLVDLDSILNDNQENEFINGYNRVIKEQNVEILINSPCLEFWYLLHFKDTSRYFKKCSNVIREIRKHPELANYKKSKRYYLQSGNDVYKKLKPFQKDAIKNARKLGRVDLNNLYLAKAEIYEMIKFFLSSVKSN